MTLDQLRALADEFFEWPIAHNKSTVTLTSALLFTQHVLEMREMHEMHEMHEKHEKSLGTNETSLGTENSAGVDALRAAMKLEQEPNNPGECSECHAPVGSVCSDADCPGKAAPLITKPTDFVSLLREADEIVRAKPTWRRFIDGTPLSNDIAVWMVVFAQDVARRNPTAALRADAERYRYLLGHARRIDVAGWSINHMEQLSPRIDAAREEA